MHARKGGTSAPNPTEDAASRRGGGDRHRSTVAAPLPLTCPTSAWIDQPRGGSVQPDEPPPGPAGSVRG